jgi:hypothetical protein
MVSGEPVLRWAIAQRPEVRADHLRPLAMFRGKGA